MKGPPPLPNARARSDRTLSLPPVNLGSLALTSLPARRADRVEAARSSELAADHSPPSRARAQSGVMRRSVARAPARTVRMRAAPTMRRNVLLMLVTFAAVLLTVYALVLWLRPPIAPARATPHIAPGSAELLPMRPIEIHTPPTVASAAQTSDSRPVVLPSAPERPETPAKTHTRRHTRRHASHALTHRARGQRH